MFTLKQIVFNDNLLKITPQKIITLCKIQNDNKMINAVAKLRNPRTFTYDEVISEITALCKLTHTNILSIIGINLEHGVILTEHMEKGNLYFVCKASVVM